MDLKDEVNLINQNILIDEHYRIKLIDFGSCSKLGSFRGGRGTEIFSAPEILQGGCYDGAEAEVWSLGCLLYTLVTKEHPFQCAEEVLEFDGSLPALRLCKNDS